ncbi:nucleoside deaminase [Holzapfeliella floricola]|uniref:tRNA-specific adenosine deaminase n=1 Tax=Holzapfeliella floricola DSM 23037 = JCM 16512 TaxID=1423744 RepID=A0A0R2DR12_9LACO|nr:nucleoside deaminase [Holzapfeliella floricola]KRN04229.1 nucleoside deaminase [Holzapfeliella floricola DSM 23037 = JCM 16512]
MISKEDKQIFMQAAFSEAEKARQKDEVPIGAVVVKDSQIIGTGHNEREEKQDATLHAETTAIRMACEYLNSWRLEGCQLFVTLEPCPMCAGAIINSRIETVYYSAFDPKAGACGSVLDLFAVEKLNHHPRAYGGLYLDQGKQILKTFFQDIRKRQKLLKKGRKNNADTL